MADSPSSILLLRLQSTGSNTNLWGGYLNTALQTIERASKGYEALAVTGDATISWTNYSAANSGSVAVLKLTGSLVAPAALKFPSLRNFGMVWNKAGQPVTIKCSGGTGATIPTGRKALLFCDGTDYFFAASNYIGDDITETNNRDLVDYLALSTYVTAAINAATIGSGGGFNVPFIFVAVGGETSLSGIDSLGQTLAYTPGAVEVYLNGVKLIGFGQDYAASTGTSITSLTALSASDVVEVVALPSFSVANTYTQAQTNALFASPPVGVGSTTPTTGAFTTLSASGATALNTVTVGSMAVATSATAASLAITGNSSLNTTQVSGLTSTGLASIASLAVSGNSALNTTQVSGFTSTRLATLSAGFSAGANSSVTGTLGVSSTLNANGGVSTSSGDLNLTSTTTNVKHTAGGQMFFSLYNSSLGSDLKSWASSNNGDYLFYATNDAISAATLGYQMARGTTYNVASHTWNTSTVAGTPVKGMSLTTTSITLDRAVTLTGQTVGTTVGGAGGASALPATPLGYITTSINGTSCKIPYYSP